MSDNKKQLIKKLQSLINKFKSYENMYCDPKFDYNETELRVDFLNELFEIFGWDVKNSRNLPKPFREVVMEANVNVDDNIKKPDYEFRFNGIRKFFVEAKKPSVNLEKSASSAYQTRRYGWSAKLPISILSNFEKTIIYDCTVIPKEDDAPKKCIIKSYHYSEYVEKFDEIYDLISKNALQNGQFDVAFDVNIERRADQLFDEFFLKQIEKWRLLLGNDIVANNPEINEEELNYLVQIFINRIIFLRICEDRNLEKYGKLKLLDESDAIEKLFDLFYEADKKYDSGLFDFITDKLSPSIHINNKVLIDIVEDLYYPNSPYSFAVVDPKILGDIYEHFIAKTLIKTAKGHVTIEDKPEVVAANGIYNTPSYIVKRIVSTSIDFEDKFTDTKELKKIKLADIACGSGVFLIESFDLLLNKYLEFYIKEKKFNHLRKDDSGDYFLTLNARKEILLNNIFGIDIDEHAVEVAKFSLLLKVIEDVPSAELDVALLNKEKVLPSLSSNIICGNSLIGDSYFEFRKTNSIASSELASIKPLNIKEKFKNVFDNNNGFGIVLGNPPYIKIQKMVEYSPLEVDYYKSNYCNFISSKGNNFDKYMLFVERALEIVNEEGIIGFILPNKFITTKAGKPLRKLLSHNKYLMKLVHFGENQIFAGKATTYTALLFLNKKGQDPFSYNKVEDLKKWKNLEEVKYRDISLETLGDESWSFLNEEEKELFGNLGNNTKFILDDIAEIFVGLQTSADDIFIINPIDSNAKEIKFKDQQGKTWTIEKEILRPAILDLSINALSKFSFNRWMIFPYRLENDKVTLLKESVFKKHYPKAYAYFAANKTRLSERHFSNANPIWYQFGRSQSLQKFTEPKIIIKNPANQACAIYDKSNTLFTGGGNGPYYGIRSINSDYDNFVILAILNSNIFDRWVKSKSSVFRGGYYSFGKQFIKNFPIFSRSNKNSKLVKELSNKWQEIIKLNYDNAKTPSQINLVSERKQFLKKEAENLINELYNLQT